MYFPVLSMPIIGGMGTYNSTLAVINGNFGSSSLYQYLLRDSTSSIPAPPISPYCTQAGDSCVSYLIPGGLATVYPWPFARDEHYDISAFITESAPAYQIDFWKGPPNLDFNPSSCNLYGMYGEVLQLCIASYGSITGHLVAGSMRRDIPVLTTDTLI